LQGRVNSWLTFKSGAKAVPPPPQQVLKRPPQPPPPAPTNSTKSPSSQYSQWLTSGESSGKVPVNLIANDEPAEKKKKKEKKFSPMGFRPPKHKPESR